MLPEARPPAPAGAASPIALHGRADRTVRPSPASFGADRVRGWKPLPPEPSDPGERAEDRGACRRHPTFGHGAASGRLLDALVDRIMVGPAELGRRATSPIASRRRSAEVARSGRPSESNRVQVCWFPADRSLRRRGPRRRRSKSQRFPGNQSLDPTLMAERKPGPSSGDHRSGRSAHISGAPWSCPPIWLQSAHSLRCSTTCQRGSWRSGT